MEALPTWRLFGALVAIIFVVACQSGASSSPANPPAIPPVENPQTMIVQATNDLTFLAQDVTIRVGDTVRWENGGIPHNIVFNDPSITGTSLLAPGATFEATFTKAGTFNYVCEFHPPNMVGTISVQP